MIIKYNKSDILRLFPCIILFRGVYNILQDTKSTSSTNDFKMS